MYNQNSIDAVNKSLSNSWRLPLYSSYCFSNIPSAIKRLFNSAHSDLPLDCFPQRKDKGKGQIALAMFIDSFGWEFFDHYLEEVSCLKWFVDNAVCSKLTSQFPSTTTAHVTTMNTGLPLGQHGLYEWFYYDPKVGKIVCPLLYSDSLKSQRGSLSEEGVEPVAFLPSKNFYQELGDIGVSSIVVSPAEYAPSPYDDFMNKGAKCIRYTSLEHAFEIIKEIVDGEYENDLYVYFYYGEIDRVAHFSSPYSKDHKSSIKYFFSSFERSLLPVLEHNSRVVSLLFADHGHRKMLPEKSLYLNEIMPDISNYLQNGLDGNPLIKAGSPLDCFLYVKENLLTELYEKLSSQLEGRARLYFVEDLIQEGLFGKDLSEDFLDRVGNLLILPTDEWSVWWSDPKSNDVVYLGGHGGLTPSEMDIPLLVF